MSMKDYNVVLDQETARATIKDGINIAVDLVSKTLGAKSRRILIDSEYGELTASDDGTTILNKLTLEDTALNAGVKVVKEISAKQNVDEGDGTTGAAIIARSLVNDLLVSDPDKKLLLTKESGSNLKVRNEVVVGADKVITYLDKQKVAIKSKDQVVQIATVSSNDSEIGEMLGDIFDKLGQDGAVSVVEDNGLKTTYEVIDGLSFDQGWLSHHFVTDPDREEAVLEPGNNGYVNVLVTNNKLQDIKHVEKIGELFKEGINDLLIIADDISGVPLQTLIVNKLHQVFRGIAVKAPQLGGQIESLRDICAMTGATLIGEEGGIQFDTLQSLHLGKAKRVVVTANKTIIVGIGNTDAINQRIVTLENKRENEKSDYEKTKLTERISKLKGGVGSIKVGGATPIEIKDKKAKIDDAVSAVKSALNGGVVAGGGVALLMASTTLQDDGGEAILKKAIQAPFEQIMENADMNVTEFKNKSLQTGHGLNVLNGEFGDLVSMGIIDPVNVIKAEVRNAVSSAVTVANLGGMIGIVRDDKKKNNEM